MRALLCLSMVLLGTPFTAQADDAKVLEIDVRGMTCAFCVAGLENSLSKLPGVRDVAVSLKHNVARIEMMPEHEPDLAAIKEAIIDAGFTPGNVGEAS
jgi:copper chaperone CopZ